MSSLLIYPMAAHVVLTAFVYKALMLARAPKIWGIGKRVDGSNPWALIEPRISANLTNQFEWPLFFYVACLQLMQSQTKDGCVLVFAWLFIGGRMVHSLVQILTKVVSRVEKHNA